MGYLSNALTIAMSRWQMLLFFWFLFTVSVVIIIGFRLHRRHIVKTRKRHQDYDPRIEERIREMEKDPDFFPIDFRNTKKNFELFGGMRYCLASNDEEKLSYSVTPIQDLNPNDFA